MLCLCLAPVFFLLCCLLLLSICLRVLFSLTSWCCNRRILGPGFPCCPPHISSFGVLHNLMAFNTIDKPCLCRHTNWTRHSHAHLLLQQHLPSGVGQVAPNHLWHWCLPQSRGQLYSQPFSTELITTPIFQSLKSRLTLSGLVFYNQTISKTCWFFCSKCTWGVVSLSCLHHHQGPPHPPSAVTFSLKTSLTIVLKMASLISHQPYRALAPTHKYMPPTF